MASPTLRIAVIGTGGIGPYHVRQWKKIEGAQIVGVCDKRGEVGRRTAAEFDIPRVYTDLEHALSDPQVDAIDICTPNMSHREGVIASLEAGKHVLCEKPLAVEPADIEAMIGARDASGKLLMTTQHLRFERPSLVLRKMIAANRLGRVYYSRAWWLRRRMAPTSVGLLRKAEAGYGPGIDLGVHMLDLVLHLLGQPVPVAVTGYAPRMLGDRADVANQWGKYDPADFEVEDLAVGMVRFADGSVLWLETSWLLNMVPAERRGLLLHGTEAAVEWPELRLAMVRDEELLDGQVVSDLSGNGHYNALVAFTQAVLNKGSLPVPPEESLVCARVLTGLYRSAETGKEVLLG